MIRKRNTRIRSIADILKASGDPTELDPDVIVDFIFEEGLLFIAIHNIGLQPAYDISVQFKPKLTGIPAEKKKKISDIALFKQISFMPPDKQIRAFLDSSESFFSRNEPTKIVTHIRFENEKGNRFHNAITHNLEIYRDIGYIRKQG